MNPETHTKDPNPTIESPAPHAPRPNRGPASSWTTTRTNPWANQDRRKHRRFHVERPGKVFRRATQQFSAVRSHDLSFSGALLEVESQRLFEIGEIVDLGLAMNRDAVVPQSCLVQAIIVRARAITPERQAVAIRYINSGAAKLVT